MLCTHTNDRMIHPTCNQFHILKTILSCQVMCDAILQQESFLKSLATLLYRAQMCKAVFPEAFWEAESAP